MESQHTYETCLAWSLLYLAGEKPTLERELEILEHSLRFTKKDFTIGHLEAVKKLFRKLDLFIDTDFRSECNSVAQLRKAGNIEIHPCNVHNIIMDGLIDEVKLTPFLLYIDAFILYGYHHYPHFIVVLGRKGNNFEILDPWDGKMKKISEENLSIGMQSLKGCLGFAPRAILTKK